METFLNCAQAQELSRFFFDIAKGLILGGIGLAVTLPFETKLIAILLSSFLAAWFVKIGLYLLEEVE